MIRSQTELSTASREDVDQVRLAFNGFKDVASMDAHLQKYRANMDKHISDYCVPEVAEFYLPNPLELADPPVPMKPIPASAAAFRQTHLGTIRPNSLRYRVCLSCNGSSQFTKDSSYKEVISAFEKEREARQTAQRLHDELLHSQTHSQLEGSQGYEAT